MANNKKIDRWTLGYTFSKKLITQPTLWLYYRRIEINGRENLPKKQPLILTSNHQNALLDALAITVWLKVPVIFLTRADIFAKPLLEKILKIYKMLPIFRIRDGRESLKRNEEIFNESVQVILDKKSPLGIFPEGNHGDKRKLRNMVKGVFRIAFSAQETYKDQPGVKIIPMGLDYQDYYKFGKDLFLNIGKPIEVSEYWKGYEESPALTINKLKDRLASEIKKMMIHIDSEEHYETIQGLRPIGRPMVYKHLDLQKNNLTNNFIADKFLVEKLEKLEAENDSEIKLLSSNYSEFKRLSSELKLRDWVFEKRKPLLLSTFSLLIYLILSPFILFGLFNNWPVFYIPPILAKKAKDTQMKSTFSWGAAAAIELIYYPILAIAGFMFLPALWMKILYIPLIPMSGILAFKIRNGIIKSYAGIRYMLLRNKNYSLKRAIELHKDILSTIKDAIHA